MGGLSVTKRFPFGIWTLDIGRELVFADKVIFDYFGISVDQDQAGVPLKEVMDTLKSRQTAAGLIKISGHVEDIGASSLRMVGIINDASSDVLMDAPGRSKILHILNEARSRSVQLEVAYLIELAMLDLNYKS